MRRSLSYHIGLISRMTTYRFILHIRNAGSQWLSCTVKINLREYSLGNSVNCEVVWSNSLRDCGVEGKEIMRKVSKKEYSMKGVWKIWSCTCHLFKEWVDSVNVFVFRMDANLGWMSHSSSSCRSIVIRHIVKKRMVEDIGNNAINSLINGDPFSLVSSKYVPTSLESSSTTFESYNITNTGTISPPLLSLSVSLLPPPSKSSLFSFMLDEPCISLPHLFSSGPLCSKLPTIHVSDFTICSAFCSFFIGLHIFLFAHSYPSNFVCSLTAVLFLSLIWGPFPFNLEIHSLGIIFTILDLLTFYTALF